jgi:hypothetical protein
MPALGRLTVNGKPIKVRDGVAAHAVDKIEIAAQEDSEILLADVPALQ